MRFGAQPGDYDEGVTFVPPQADLQLPGSQVQLARSAVTSQAIAEEAARSAAALEFQKQQTAERNKMIKYGMIGVGVLLLIKVLK